MLLFQEFDIEIQDRSRAHNLVVDHLSRTEKEDDTTIQDDFHEVLLVVTIVKRMCLEPWFSNIINYLVVFAIPSSFSKSNRTKLKSDARYYVLDEPFLWLIGSDQVIKGCVPDIEIPYVLEFCHTSPFSGNYDTERTKRKVLDCALYWTTIFKYAQKVYENCEQCQRVANSITRRVEAPQ